MISLFLMLFLGYHHIRVHAPGATEAATVRNDFSCKICNSQLKEDMKFRVLGGEGEFCVCTGHLRKLHFRTIVLCICVCLFVDRQTVGGAGSL